MTDLSFGKIQMGHPIHSVLGAGVGLSGSAGRMALFPVGLNSVGMYM